MGTQAQQALEIIQFSLDRVCEVKIQKIGQQGIRKRKSRIRKEIAYNVGIVVLTRINPLMLFK